ncbi:MAG: hypothetical protein Q8J76_13050 [Desulfobulbaceae bacterium]|nr:hypothetical protein [Desulfobulbaceae bacterium]
MNSSKHLILPIDRLWDGSIADADEQAKVVFALTPSGMNVEVTARFHGDPAPNQPVGQTDGLWNYEVVELFVANEKDEYLELEIGPHGHYLALLFSGKRLLTRQDIVVFCQTTIDGALWRATAHVPQSCLPHNLSRANAYAIHGREGGRRFLAAFPLSGTQPDFHQLNFFKPLTDIVRV